MFDRGWELQALGQVEAIDVMLCWCFPLNKGSPLRFFSHPSTSRCASEFVYLAKDCRSDVDIGH